MASDPRLLLIIPLVAKLEKVSGRDKYIDETLKKLDSLLNNPSFALDAISANEFGQQLAEAHFYCLCKEKNVELKKIPESEIKSPDFEVTTSKSPHYCEVKTPTFVGGISTANQQLNEVMELRIQQEERLRQGASVASYAVEVRLYGDTECSLTAWSNALLSKAKQLLHPGQFENGDTFLVLNLLLLTPFRTDSSAIRKKVHDPYLDMELSGQLWLLAFGETTTPVYGLKDSLDQSDNREGDFGSSGILNEYPNVRGILVVVYPLQGDPRIFGLLRSKDLKNISATMSWVNRLCDGDLNDENDSLSQRRVNRNP